MSSQKPEISKLSKEEEQLLNTLVDKGIRESLPQRLGDGVAYVGLKEFTDEKSEKEVKKLLKSLTQKGFLKEKDSDSALFCPRCGSLHNFSRYSCPQCQSLNVHRVQLIEHRFCGYIGNRSEFETDDGLVCPKCKTVIGDFWAAQNKEQADKSKVINVIGSSFACDKCGSKFERPIIQHTCERCLANFSYREALYEKLPSYELTAKVDELLPNRFIMDALRQVESVFVEKGYQVEIQGKLVGKSGIEQSFNLIAKKGENRVVLDVSAWGNQNDLISLLGKKMDIDSKSIILLDLAGNPTIASLGKPYNILVLDTKDDKYKEKLAAALDDVGKEEDDKRKSPRKR